MTKESNESTLIIDERIKSKVETMEARYRELYKEGKRGVKILDVLCTEFFYNHRNSIYRKIDVSKLIVEMKSN